MKKGFKTVRWLVLIAVSGMLILSGEAVLCGYLEDKFSRMMSDNLSEKLGTAVTVEAVRVDLWGRQAGFYGFRIGQPDGFGDDSLLHLPALEATVSLSGLFARKLTLTRVLFSDAEIRFAANTNGLCNIQLMAQRFGRSREESDAGSFFDALAVEELKGDDCRIRVYEPVDSSNVVQYALTDISVQLSGFRYEQRVAENALPDGSLRITGRIRKGTFPDGRWGAAAAFGPFGAGLPMMRGALRIVGMELSILEPVLMDNAALILGGNSIDLSADILRSSAGLDGSVTLETIAGYRYEAAVRGTLRNPSLQIEQNALSLVLERSGGLMGKVYRNVLSSGKEAVAGSGAAAAGVIKSASKSVESFGEGLFKTVEGAATLDLSDMKQGLQTMGASVSGGTQDAVFTAGGEIMEGVGSVGGELSGEANARAWRSSIPQRWEEAWQDALSRVE